MISWATVEYSSSLEPEIILKIPLLKAYMLTKKAITIFLSFLPHGASKASLSQSM